MSWKLKEKARVLLSQEKGTIIKPWGGKISVALIFPNYYHVGMANLGFQIVYRIINDHPQAVCERAFLPQPAELLEFQRSSTPLFSLESQTPLQQFDIIAFSLSFENDYPNVLTLLDLARIPLRSFQRKEGYPLVCAGGITTFLNPEPLAEFIDFFALGEAEELVPEWLNLLYELKAKKVLRREILKQLTQVEGVYVPQFYSITYNEDGTIASFSPKKGIPYPVKRRWIKNLNNYPAHSVISSPTIELGGMFLLEIGRGCSFGCRFCAAGWIYRPVRFRSLNALEESLSAGLIQDNKIGLVSAAIGDHPKLKAICQLIRDKGGKISVSSLRANAITPELLTALKESGHQSITMAPETGSERLRRLIRKNITDEEIFAAVELIALIGIPNLRLYFLLGLPSETIADIDQIISLTKKIKHTIIKQVKKKNLPGTITLSLSPFVPKPFTPFQWVAFENLGVLNQKIKHIQNGLKNERQIIITYDLPKWSYIQALLSRSDRRASKILLEVHKKNGNWNKALQETDINPDFYVYRHREFNEILPWDFIDQGIKKETLISEYHQALTLI